jgi:hypothetical protein
MKTITVYDVVVNNKIHYSCLSSEEAEDFGTAYYGEKDKDFFVEPYDHQPVDHTKPKQ